MTDRRCATCGEAHVWTQERGFYGADGHPFKVVGEALRVADGGYDQFHQTPDAVAGRWRSSFFGALIACERCGMVADPKHKDLVALHEERCS